MLSRQFTGCTGHDGALDLHVPLGLPDQSVEVMVIVEPITSKKQGDNGTIESFFGCLQGSSSLSESPQSIQRRMRDEWD